MRGARVVGVLLLLWSVMGLAAFAMQVGADPAMMAASDPVSAAAFAQMPAWAWGAYAVATLAGFAGSIALLMRRRAAVGLFAVSLAGVVVQFGWTFLVFELGQKKGWNTAIFPLVIAAIAMAATLYALARRRDGTFR